MKKLLLIQASGSIRKGLSVTQSKYPSLALGIIASLTGSDWDIEIIDSLSEEYEGHNADLVAITSYTATISNAYSIASYYKEKKIPVILGGIHASLMPYEASQYCDIIATGEAESIWPQILSDFNRKKLKKLYTGSTGGGITSPDRSRFSSEYNLTSVQASRGCPMRCDYCSVTELSGKIYRRRPVKDIIEDWKKITQQFVWFSDDNLFGFGEADKTWLKELFSELIRNKLQRNWMCFAGVNSLLDETTIALAAQSGCKIIYVGFETEDPAILRGVNKNPMQVKNYEKVISLLHKHGIAVLAGIMLGFDNDTPRTIEDRIDFVINSDIDSYFLTVTTPMPGTRMFERFLKKGKLRYTNFPEDWGHYDWTQMVFRPEKMSIKQAEDAIYKAYQKAYAYQQIKEKYRYTRDNLGSADTAMLNYLSNMDFRDTFLKQF